MSQTFPAEHPDEEVEVGTITREQKAQWIVQLSTGNETARWQIQEHLQKLYRVQERFNALLAVLQDHSDRKVYINAIGKAAREAIFFGQLLSGKCLSWNLS
jgi:hypothetical protein